MRKIFLLFFMVFMIFGLSSISYATNGDNLIGIGPIARAMGGVGIADPQDAISAVFANPAAMCFGPYCPGGEFNFAGTLFMPTVDGEVDVAGSKISADSHKKTYPIPAIGISVPINTSWRFGLAAYGTSGLGVDYKDTKLDQPQYYNFGPFGQFPLVAGEYTQLQIMKFAPSIAYRATDKLSLGLALHIDYAVLDLRDGSSPNFGYGAQLGAIYKLTDMINLGATYITPQEVNHKRVKDFNGDGHLDDLKLEIPQQLGVGLSVEPIKELLLEVNGRWINWSDATGYNDFDWKDQWVLALGAQYKPVKELALRVGYNYGNNPVKEHGHFVGTDMIKVQGKSMPTYYYETFRIIGFPAVVKQHITTGIGYELSKSVSLNAGYTHAFKETIKENGTDIAGQPVTLKSRLSEDSVEFGLTYRF